MRSLLVVHGLKRSGNHAVVNWLLGCEDLLFFNNIIPIRPILAGERPMPPPEDFRAWLSRQLLPPGLRFPLFLGLSAEAKRSIMVSLEDHELTVAPFSNVWRPVTNILILRDPVNLLASRIRKGAAKRHPAYPRETGADMQRVVALWKTHAREHLGLTRLLEPKVCVYFNAWFSCPEYRREVARRLGVEFTDLGFSHVSDVGGGSSFEQTRFDGNNTGMSVLEREAQLADAERDVLERALDDAELLELSARLAAAYPEGRTPIPGSRASYAS